MLAFNRRTFSLAALSVLLAGCQVVPRPAPQPIPLPTPTPAPGPSADVLPTDTARHRVALLVPMTGANAEVGRSIANATTMALLDTNAQNLRITTYDTGANAGTAAARAIADGNKLILGPLVREDVAPVLAQARPANVPLITFSNDTSIAAGDVFVMGHVPDQSIARSVAYASGQGVRRYAALVPSGEYGARATQALSQAAAATGGTVVGTERYDRGNTSIISAAERLKAAGGYDAVLLADGARLSGLAAGALTQGGVRPRLIGTELWSGEASIASSAPLRGAWFSAVADTRYRQFVTSYQTRFGEQPYRIATLGYDAVLLALRLARDWQPGTNLPLAQMVGAEGFLGLDGPFRFRRDGVGERAMEVRQVGSGAISVVDPAPARF